MTCKNSLKALAWWLAVATAPVLAADKCSVEPVARTAPGGSPWITKENWLAAENLRYGLANMQKFMPTVRLAAGGPAAPLGKADRPLNLQALAAADPMDGQSRNVAFLLDTRLYADGVLVLRDGSVLFEDYRNGLTAAEPRLIGSATRPVLSMLAAISTAKGKLRQEHALSRHVPQLSPIAELRKISLHRLLNKPDAFRWDAADLAAWQRVGGWNSDAPQGDLRDWARTAAWHLASKDQPGTINGPEGQLVVWALENAWKQALPKVFCERLFAPGGPEHSAYWATDSEGNPLADGLALSLRDFARLGTVLLDSRGSSRGLLPGWFAESIAGGGSAGESPAGYLAGLDQGAQVRYGFIHLNGPGRRAAAIGPHGNSVFVDFDRRLVIAVFASYPAERSPLMLQTLGKVWEAIDGAEAKAPR